MANSESAVELREIDDGTYAEYVTDDGTYAEYEQDVAYATYGILDGRERPKPKRICCGHFLKQKKTILYKNF